MDDMQRDWERYIARLKRVGAGTYGEKHFMAATHWKFLWAAERIAELEAEVDGKDLLIEDLNHQIDGFKELEAEVKALREAADRVVLPSIQECKNLAALLQDKKG